MRKLYLPYKGSENYEELYLLYKRGKNYEKIISSIY